MPIMEVSCSVSALAHVDKTVKVTHKGVYDVLLRGTENGGHVTTNGEPPLDIDLVDGMVAVSSFVTQDSGKGVYRYVGGTIEQLEQWLRDKKFPEYTTHLR